jgi:hypothetical protein
MLHEGASAIDEDVIYITSEDLVLEASQYFINEITEMAASVAPPIGNTFPPIQTEVCNKGEVVPIFGLDTHREVTPTDVE